MRRTWTTKTFLVRVVQINSLNASSSQAHGPHSSLPELKVINRRNRRNRRARTANLPQNGRKNTASAQEKPAASAQGEPALRSHSNKQRGVHGSRSLAQGERTTAASAQPLAQGEPAEKNAFRMVVEMECFRMGRWAPRRPMASEGKTPLAPEEPKPLAVGFDRLRSEESSLAVSDRAVGPGQQRPSPR